MIALQRSHRLGGRSVFFFKSWSFLVFPLSPVEISWGLLLGSQIALHIFICERIKSLLENR